MKRLLALLVVASAISVSAPQAQDTSLPAQSAKFVKKGTTPRGRAIDTRAFFPQILKLDRPIVLRKENEFRPPWRLTQTEPNTIPTGEVLPLDRVSPRTLFPGPTFSGWVPPDPDMAVGPNHVVATVNVDIGFYTKSGSQTFLQPLATFFSAVGAGPEADLFDPKCYYDKISGRFVVLCLEQNSGTQTSKFLVGISDNNDPNGVWFLYRLEAKMIIGGSPCWADYPGFGYNKDAFVITANMFGFGGGYGGVQLMTLRKAAMLTGGAATTFTFLDQNAFGVQIAETTDPLLDRIYCVSDFNTSNMKIHAFTNLLGSPPTLSSTFLAIPSFTYPTVNCPSPGGRTLDSLDGRLINACYRGGRVVTTHGVQVGGTELKCRWYEINMNNYPSSAPTLNQSGNVAGPAGQYYFMPAIYSNELGDISIVFTRSSASIVADMMAVGRRATDPTGSMGTPVLLESSLGATYGGAGFNRWGDYFGIETDPTNETTFWGIAMTGNGGGGWRTGIYSWNISAPIVLNSITVSPGSVIGGNPSTGTATLSGNAPAGGYTVALTSSNPAVAQVPTSVTVPQGASSQNFNITTSPVAVDTGVTITGSFRGVNRQATLTVQWSNQVVNPSLFSYLGQLLSGNLNSLFAIDGDRLSIRVSPDNEDLIPVKLIIEANLPVSSASRIDVLLTSRAFSANKLQRIHLFDWTLNQYVLLDSRFIPSVDTSVTASATTNLARFIQTGTNKVRALIDWQEPASDTLELWRTETDRAVFQVFR